MARPEKPITWDGPIADLARELRRLRELAGPPIPTYAQLAERGTFSRSVLADAAAGYRCPSWEVVIHFVTACGGLPGQEPWPTLWRHAHAAGQAGDATPRRPARAAPAKSRTSARQATVTAAQQGPAPPDPWQAETPQEYRYQLSLLRVWAGVSIPEICRHSGYDDHRRSGVAYATVHDTLNAKFARMPPLRAVRAIVAACEADLDQWVGAWRAISLKQFQQDNPPPASLALENG
ncbi:helix-turn-helix domain-containing protein [Nonomuraea turkmeniaca]|uniref:Helix-turn-helix domain-containing protein n=1 Tax=Nonomuraea turkmeniaca TaxID=103838 RepID=A0A5S4EZT9_9ACTN|nr:helix-turn-helix domain-containing protein [Nonomuraea turkmeniaca]TMR09218.1 helix-turn-helix domain-containing protein [Nonomuraea turkmeniaca]